MRKETLDFYSFPLETKITKCTV